MSKPYRYIKKIEMNFGDADFIIGDTYFYTSGRDEDERAEGSGGFVDIYGDLHYMPHPSEGRDPVDGWDTNDYFEEVVE